MGTSPARRGEDPQWPRASEWLGTGAAAAPLAVLGVPLSVTSISPSRADRTPQAVRRALHRFSTYCAPLDVDLLDVGVADWGDLDLGGLGGEDVREVIALGVAEVRADLLVVLGGDNALTRPALAGRAQRLDRAALLTLDAHHDVRGFHAGPTNGTPVRGLLADGLPGRNVVQVGIGDFTNSRAHRRWAEQQGITPVGVAEARDEGVGACVRRHLDLLAERADEIWVDLDVDVLDRAFAPGCPGARPGGLTPAELHAAAGEAGAHPAVTGIDVVEVDAEADPGGATVDAAALCLLWAAAGWASRQGG